MTLDAQTREKLNQAYDQACDVVRRKHFDAHPVSKKETPVKALWRSVSTQGKLTALTVIVLSLTLVLTQSYRAAARHIETRAFRSNFTEYLAVPPKRAEGEPYLRGKVLVIDVPANSVDIELQPRLPASVRATKPEEVGTVVLLSCQQVKIGHYGRDPDAAASRWRCDFTVIDEKEKVRITEMRVTGTRPPEKTTGGGGASGSKPTDDIFQWLLSLPRKVE